MKGRGIKPPESSSVLLMFFSTWQSEITNFNYTLYTPFLVVGGFFLAFEFWLVGVGVFWLLIFG